MTTHNSSSARVGVLGASGYTGQELLRVLHGHRGVEILFATSEREAGERSPVPGLTLVSAEAAPLDAVEVAFLCLPHGEAAPWAERALAAGARVVDLTADHRPGSGREGGAVFGMADLLDGPLPDARLVANPGCYPTGVCLALEPLRRDGLVDTSRTVVANAASGVTGAGRAPRRDLLFAEVANDYRAYAVGNTHRHIKEMRHVLQGLELIFQPHLLPIPRGILETIYVPVPAGVDAARVRTAWKEAWDGRATITVLDEGVPGLAEVVHTDRLVLGAVDNEGAPGVVTLVAAFDNLGKGAAGQAVHNMNLMLGFEPERGLRC